MREKGFGDDKLVRTVLSEQIKEQLIDDILHKKYKPGDRLVESALANELNVSQAPVREALKTLIAMGFLETEPYKGITVRSFSSQDLWEIITVRASLESLSARLLAERITPDQIEHLEELLKEMIKAGKKGDIPKRTKLNIEFHEYLIRASGHKLILQLFQNMRFGSWSIMTGSFTQMDPVYMATRHRKLIEAIKSRDPDKAAKAMREHIESVGEPICEMLAEEKEPEIKNAVS